MTILTLQFFKLTNKLHNIFLSKPMLANSLTGFIIFTSGDIISQYIQNNQLYNYNNNNNHLNKGNYSNSTFLEQILSIDITRSIKTGTLGIFMNGIMLHYWYRSLDLLFGNSMKRMSSVVLKVVLDQLVYAPFSIGVFFSVASYGKGGNLNSMYLNLKEKTEESFIDTWAADCMVWPLVNFLNFRYIPIYMRPTFVGFAQLMWQTYMSTVSYRECQKQKVLNEILPSLNQSKYLLQQ